MHITSIADEKRPKWLSAPNRTLVVAALLISSIIVLLAFFESRWEINDYIGMSMVVHGHGTAANAVPNIFFSNVLWGQIISVIPAVRGIPGYSLATMVCMIVSGLAFVFAFQRLNLSLLLTIPLLFILLVRPLLFPQFTITAGLISLAGILFVYIYQCFDDLLCLSLGLAAIAVAFIIRFEEVALVAIVSLPFFGSDILRKKLLDRLGRSNPIHLICNSHRSDCIYRS